MWFWAAFLMSTHSNGISARLQLQSRAELGFVPNRLGMLKHAQAAPDAMVNPEQRAAQRPGQGRRDDHPVPHQEQPGRRARRPQTGSAKMLVQPGAKGSRIDGGKPTARPAQSDRGLWQAGTSCLRGARRHRPANPAWVTDDLAVLPEPFPVSGTTTITLGPMAAHIALPWIPIGLFIN